jgi:hypothetical protein
MSGKMDEAKRLVIALMAAKEDLSEDERTRLVKELLDDGLTIADIMELVPRLLSASPSKPAETSSDRPATVRTTHRLSPERDRTTGSASAA